MGIGIRVFVLGTVMALTLCLGWGCDYTPSPTPASSPSPSPLTQQGAVPIIVVPISSPGTGPVPPVPSASMFRIVSATPAANSIISLPARTLAPVHSPILDFEFRYHQNLTLDDDYTNFEIALLVGDRGNNAVCLWTDLGRAIRLDREDKVYLANSVARFRTGVWRYPSSFCGGSSFTTRLVHFKMTPDVSRPDESWIFVPMEWAFLRR